MNTVVGNQNQTIYHSPVVSLRDNGKFYSEIEETVTPVSYKSFQSLSKTENLSFEVGFSDFDYTFYFYIADFKWSLDSNEIVLFLNLDNKLVINVVLEGFWTNGKEPTFQHKSSSWNLHQKLETPISNFLLSTLWVMLNLSERVSMNMPDFNYYFTSSFNLPLNNISEILQERQIAYRLMVIESALQIPLPFPNGEIEGKDVEAISFCYHAIVDREFDWFAKPQFIPWKANEESLSWLPETAEPTTVTFMPDIVVKHIFGIEIPLGIMTCRIDKMVIDNYEEVKENLSKLDGSVVEAKVRSINGISKMIALRVPQLSQSAWSKKLQKLIDLDSKLDSIVLDKYFALATSAFEGLTEEQKEAILERPDLDEESFDF
ncbi:MAG: hypothetical protein M3384_16315 [Acidobacteriota bacterium]|nr:hypothetical protein [Acidobacteriota bacterium]